MNTHKEFADTSASFLRYCKLAKVVPTKRQASKFKRHIGAAWKAFLFSNAKSELKC